MLRSARVWLGMAVSAAFIGLLLFQTDLGLVADALRKANYWWVAPAVAIYLLSVWVRAIRYRHILRGVADVPSAQLFSVLTIGYMANNVLPARMGEVVRAYVLGEKHGVSKMAGLGTIAVERLFDGLTLLGMLAISVVLLGGDSIVIDLALVSVPIFAVALAVFVVALLAPDWTERMVNLLCRLLPPRFRGKVRDLAWAFVEGLRSLRHPDAFAWVVVTSVLAWMMEAVVYAFVGHGFGLGVGFGYYVMAVGAGNLAISAPSSQGGIGPFEYFVKAVMIGAGALEGGATAYSFAVHAVIIVPATILGFYYLSTMHLSLGRLRQRAEPAYQPVAVDGSADD